jgi:aromatase
MHSEIAIRIAAPPDLVFALARDVERWADLLPHYARSAAVERRPDGSVVADFVARRPLIAVLGLGLPVTWRSRTWSEPGARRLRFVHVAGATKGMDVTWRIEPAGAGDPADGTGCTVTIEHHFAPRLPGFAAFVDRFFTRPIAGRTLATFKALAEALQSATALPTNPSP